MSEISYSRGLAGVIADESKICTIDGVKGELYYMGYPIQVLAEKSTFTEITYLLFHGTLPATQSELTAFEDSLRSHRALPDEVRAALKTLPQSAHPMSCLQALVAVTGMRDPGTGSDGRAKNLDRAIRLTAQFPSMVAAIHRHRSGADIIEPRDDLSHAANFLYMLNGEVPSEQIERMFDVCLILHAEHTFNASTFTGRVVGSTLADLYSSVSAAVGALYGPLHGGANEKVLDMVREIGEPHRVESWFEEAVNSKRKIMGMGHRVYKTMDPRAKILRKMLDELSETRKDRNGLEILDNLASLMAKKVEAEGKQIWPNVDFFSGTLYSLIGIESINFTPIFGVARVAGWCSHILELWDDNRLYRPKAHYVGDKDLEYKPIGER